MTAPAPTLDQILAEWRGGDQQTALRMADEHRLSRITITTTGKSDRPAIREITDERSSRS